MVIKNAATLKVTSIIVPVVIAFKAIAKHPPQKLAAILTTKSLLLAYFHWIKIYARMVVTAPCGQVRVKELPL